MKSDPNLEQRSRVVSSSGGLTLEELLRLKRAERPDEAFWSEFERGMRHKQLAAIIEPRPWWLGLSIWGRRVAPAALPVAATAALALAFVTMRQAAPELGAGRIEFAAVGAGPGAPLEAVVGQATTEHVHDAEVEVAMTEVAALDAERADESANGSSDANAMIEAPASVVDGVSSLLVAVAGSGPVSTAPVSQTVIEATMAGLESDGVSLAGTAGMASNADEAELLPVAAVPRSSRQERLLALAQVDDLSNSSATLAQVRERMVHRLASDEGSYGSAGRLGLGADRLYLRF